jgi:putative oxidoreductase
MLSSLARYREDCLSLLRFMSALLILQHGTIKVLDFPDAPMNEVPLTSMGGIAGFFELIGGILLAIGLFTRPVAFILSGMTAVAYFYAHAPQGFYPNLNGGELAVLYCFTFLYIACAGGGRWSVDAMMGERTPARGSV